MLAIMNPFDLHGPDFLTLYGVFAAIAIVVILVFRRTVRSAGGAYGEPPKLDAYETAFLAGGGSRVVMLAIASAADDGLLKLKGTLLEAQGNADAKTHPVVRTLVLGSRSMTLRNAREKLSTTCEAMRQSLQSHGLLVSDASRNLYAAAVGMIMGSLVVFGLIKFAVGVSRGKPIGFLTVLSIIAFFVMIIFIKNRPFRTIAGDAAVKKLQSTMPKKQAKTVYQDSTAMPLGMATGGAAMMVALWGLPALAGHPEYEHFKQTLQPMHAGGADGGSSCSSSSCSSGSSCGGGGCGGCGGGGD